MCARCLVILSVLAALLMSSASAEIPQLISYQGKVTDSGGTPIADGNYPMEFDIFDAASGGSSLWSSGGVTVTVSGGVFSVLLGDAGQPALDLEFSADYWVEVDIAGDLQNPRTRLGSVGYAYMASGLVPGTGVDWTSTWPTLAVMNGGSGPGLYGESNLGAGVWGASAATNGRGVYGLASAPTGTNYGVCGETNSTDGFAGYFAGRTRVLGDLTVTSGGKVGIGVTSPGNPLVVSGAESDTAGTGAQVRIHDSSNDNHAFALRIGASGNQNLNIDSYWGAWQTLMTVDRETGQVGLGTDTPDRDLSVVGYVRASNDVDETEYTEIYHGGGNGFINWNGDGNFEIRYANSAKVAVQQDGDVGIGTTNPGAKLDVRGDVIVNEGGSDYDFRVEGDTEPNLLLVDAGTDRIGVGTPTPGATLDVHGGTDAIAVRGESGASSGWGVYGYATATGPGQYSYGVVGRSACPLGAGVYGEASTTDGPASGGYFECGSITGKGVVGCATATTGPTIGVSGTTGSPSGRGVVGSASATTGTANGVRGIAGSTNGYGVYSEGNLGCSGTKSCIVKTSRGPTLLYCQESPENWFEDFGEGRLASGRCRIDLDPLFLETVTIDAANPMHVFLQPNDEACVGLVVKKGISGFEVVSPLDRNASGAFSYRVVAKRKGFETTRLDVCEAALNDSYLYPELREKETRKRDVQMMP